MKKAILLVALATLAEGASAQINLNNGLLAHYPFDGDASDVTMNGNDGTVNGALQLVQDRFGNADGAYYFDGTGNWIDVNTLNQTFSEITLTVWAKSNNPNSLGTIVSKHSNGADLTVLLRAEFGNNNCAWTINGNYFGQSAGPYSTNEFDFIVMSYNGSEAKLYVNNVLMASTAATGNLGQNLYPFAFGRYAAGGGIQEYYDGTIDDIRIYDRALNDQEIDALFNEPNPQSPLTAQCPGSFNMFESTDGNLVPDVTSSTTYTTNCPTPGPMIITQNPAVGTQLNNGANVITVTLEDQCMNTVTCDVTINYINDLGIEEYSANSMLTVAPNPASGSISVNSKVSTMIHITNVLGERLVSTFCADTLHIDVSNFTPGIYFIHSEIGKAVRFIKE